MSDAELLKLALQWLRYAEEDLEALSEHAVEVRYPGPWPEASTGDAAEALDLAESICEAMRMRISE